MLRIVFVLVALAVVFAVARFALRRPRPDQPAIDPADDAFMRNVRAIPGNVRAVPLSPEER